MPTNSSQNVFPLLNLLQNVFVRLFLKSNHPFLPSSLKTNVIQRYNRKPGFSVSGDYKKKTNPKNMIINILYSGVLSPVFLFPFCTLINAAISYKTPVNTFWSKQSRYLRIKMLFNATNLRSPSPLCQCNGLSGTDSRHDHCLGANVSLLAGSNS